MLDEFDFHLLQLRYLREAMNDFANYRPDDWTVAQLDTFIAGAKTVRTAFLNAKTGLDLAMGGRNSAQGNLHDACVAVFGILKTRYRKDAVSTEVIAKLPVDDKTPKETLKRGESISVLWGKLPNPPGSVTEFKAWDTMDKDAFDALVTALDDTLDSFTDDTDDHDEAQANVHTKDAEMLDFIGAALSQGRHQFADGTAQREIIDHIPVVPATQAPAKAVITSATGPAAGTLQATGDADHATSFDWFRKGPGDAAFVKVADDVIQRTYHTTGLAAGSYEIKLVGRNSRGPGPASDVSTVNVT